jgi:hypothetical protein
VVLQPKTNQQISIISFSAVPFQVKMVVTRSQTEIAKNDSHEAQSSNQGAPVPPAEQALDVSRPMTVNQNLSQSPASINSSTRSSRSATIKARKLAAEAQHARHLAQLELAAMQTEFSATQKQAELQAAQNQAEAALEKKRAELQRKTAELEYLAELAAIEADDCSRSHRSCRHSSQRNSRSQTVDVQQWLHDVTPDTGYIHPEIVPTTNQPCSNSQAFSNERNDAVVSNVGAAQSPTVLPQPNLCRGDETAAKNVRNPDYGAIGVTELVNALKNLNNNGPNNKNIILPIFDGKSPFDYLMFKRAFQDTAEFFSEAENLARLNQALKGVAREAVSMLLVMATHARDVIDALECRFGKPELIAIQEVNAIRALPKLGTEVRNLNIFATRVQNCVQVVKLLDHTDHLRSPERFGALLSKFTPLLHSRWKDFAAGHQSLGCTRVELLSLFLNREVDLEVKFGNVAEAPLSSSHHRAHTVSESGEGPSTGAIPKNSRLKISKFPVNHEICCFCQSNHQLTYCQKFRSLTIDDKWHFIKENKVCHRCLKKVSHNFKYCSKNKVGCTIPNCNRKHHTLLHCDNFSSHVPIEPVTNTLTKSEQITINTAATKVDSSRRPLLKVLAVTVSGPAGTVDTFALLDDGATATFIDSEIA